MQAYQKAYLENSRQILDLQTRPNPRHVSFDEYYEYVRHAKQEKARLGEENVALLRQELFPQLDGLYQLSPEQLQDLDEFAQLLMDNRYLHGGVMEPGLAGHILQALVNYYRRCKERNLLIRHLYELGMSRYYLYLPMMTELLDEASRYATRMRLCFVEAGAYLKFFDEIEDEETQGYIIRSLANTALGVFNQYGDKIRTVKHTLQVLQDEHYQKLAPGLPWKRYIALTHDQMTRSIPMGDMYSLQPQEVEDVMESTYIVYENQLKLAQSTGVSPYNRDLLPYYNVEYRLGIRTVEEMLTLFETMLQKADVKDYSVQGMHEILWMTAYYSLWLQTYPEQLKGREDFLLEMQQRLLRYVDAARSQVDDPSRLYWQTNQFVSCYIELEGGMDNETLMLTILKANAPEIYVHSWLVGSVAVVLSESKLEEDGAFFDDIDFIRQITDPAEKRRVVLEYAMKCGLLHDIGKLGVMDMYTIESRQWLGEEYEISQLHVSSYHKNLLSCPSTIRYADVALGHHKWYDDRRGFPERYHRLDSQYRQMVDIIALADWLSMVTDSNNLRAGEHLEVEAAIQKALTMEGNQFSPQVVNCLRDAEIHQQITSILLNGEREAYLSLYQWEQSEHPFLGESDAQD
jgi:HD-GYP domain-containing protein (c-di-GMP phosphodiesterase class II)